MPHALPRAKSSLYDVIIVGGGPAGLSAALVLGRARRRVLVCDDGRPRNAATRAVHGFLTRDGISPVELRRIGWRQLRPYDVHVRAESVVEIRPLGDRFAVRLRRTTLFGRRVLLATGVRDRLPPLEGLEPLYAKTVHHCPYCDGWEERDRALAVHGNGHGGAELALTLLGWSDDVVLLTDGPPHLGAVDRERLRHTGIRVEPRRIARLEGRGGRLRRIVFRAGPPLERGALFLSARHEQACSLSADLGCSHSAKGEILTDRLQHTNVPGLFSAGDATHDVHFVVVGAAEGAKAGVAIDRELRAEDQRLARARATVPRR